MGTQTRLLGFMTLVTAAATAVVALTAMRLPDPEAPPAGWVQMKDPVSGVRFAMPTRPANFPSGNVRGWSSASWGGYEPGGDVPWLGVDVEISSEQSPWAAVDRKLWRMPDQYGLKDGDGYSRFIEVTSVAPSHPGAVAVKVRWAEAGVDSDSVTGAQFITCIESMRLPNGVTMTVSVTMRADSDEAQSALDQVVASVETPPSLARKSVSLSVKKGYTGR